MKVTFTFCSAAPFCFAALFFISCSRNFERVKFTGSGASTYVQELTSSRLQKDAYFRSGDLSPLTPEQRKDFRHLNFYPPNLDLIFQVKLVPDGDGNRINIPATGGEMRLAEKVGEFRFDVNGKQEILHVYKMIAQDSTDLFLPFTDGTCGKTSYAGGRYIDLTEDGSGVYLLDFNNAYNPYCAYNHNYSCPIVPQENHLDVPIMAGEKKFE